MSEDEPRLYALSVKVKGDRKPHLVHGPAPWDQACEKLKLSVSVGDRFPDKWPVPFRLSEIKGMIDRHRYDENGVERNWVLWFYDLWPGEFVLIPIGKIKRDKLVLDKIKNESECSDYWGKWWGRFKDCAEKARRMMG